MSQSCRRTLATERVVDVPSSLPTPEAHVASGLRSTRRGGTAREGRPVAHDDAEQHKPPSPLYRGPADRLSSAEDALPASEADAAGSSAAAECERAVHRGASPAQDASAQPGALQNVDSTALTASTATASSCTDGPAAGVLAAGASEPLVQTAASLPQQPIVAPSDGGDALDVVEQPAAAPAKRRRKLGRNRAVLDSPDRSGQPWSGSKRLQVQVR